MVFLNRAGKGFRAVWNIGVTPDIRPEKDVVDHYFIRIISRLVVVN